jgi:hypothetical protein
MMTSNKNDTYVNGKLKRGCLDPTKIPNGLYVEKCDMWKVCDPNTSNTLKSCDVTRKQTQIYAS